MQLTQIPVRGQKRRQYKDNILAHPLYRMQIN